MRRQGSMTLRAAGLAVLSLVLGFLLPAGIANAGPDPSLCQTNTQRVTIPEAYPARACFDGTNLVIANDLQFPIKVVLTGDGIGEVKRSGLGANEIPSAALAGILSLSPTILPPGYRLTVPIGASEVRIGGEATGELAKHYANIALLYKFAPWLAKEKGTVDFAAEVVAVGDKAEQCLAKNNNWGDIACRAVLTRDLGFALGRAGINIASNVPKVVGGMLQLIETATWSDRLNGDVAKLQNAEGFTIAAAPVVRPVTPPAIPPVNNGGENGGGAAPAQPPAAQPPAAQPPVVQPPVQDNGGSNDAPPPAPPQATVTVQNKHVEGANGLVEDSTPAYLSSAMKPSCAAAGCKLSGTDMESGATFTVDCHANGAFMTNENQSVTDDDANPNRVDSTLWYRGIVNGKTGYISEVYLTPSSRGGLGLPACT